jgi:hypothetical protein
MRISLFSLLIVAFSFSLYAQNGQGNGGENRGDGMMGMMDSSMACTMMKMHAISPKAAFGTSDGGVVVIIGNKMMKYDKDLNLKKEVELKIDSTALNSMMHMMQQCPGMKSGPGGADSSRIHK